MDISSGKCAKEDMIMDIICGSGTFRWDENNSWEGDAMAGRDELMNEWIGDWYSGNYYYSGRTPREDTGTGQDRAN